MYLGVEQTAEQSMLVSKETDVLVQQLMEPGLQSFYFQL